MQQSGGRSADGHKSRPELNRLLIAAVEAGDEAQVKKILHQKANVNCVKAADGWYPDNQRTPLTAACRLGHTGIVHTLLEAGADVNRMDKHVNLQGETNHQTPLMATCECGPELHSAAASIVRLLLERGADVKAAHPKDRDGALHLAAKNGHTEIVRLLLGRNANVNAAGSWGFTPLTWAASYGKSRELVAMLLDAGARPSTGKKQPNPLFRFISSDSDDAEIARMLIDGGAELEDAGLGGALYHAAWYGKTEIVQLLLSLGMPVDSKNYNGEKTAAFSAAERKHCTIAKLLLWHGADADAKSLFDGTLLERAIESGDEELVALVIEKQREKRHGKLVPKTQRPPVPNETTAFDQGALSLAAKKGNLETVKRLIAAGFPVEDRTSRGGETPLMLATASGKIEIVQYLLDQGADIAARDNKGHTALMHAAAHGNNSAVGLLLEHGADLQAKNHLGWNALMQAVFHGHLATVSLLLKAGASPNEIDLEHGYSTLRLAAGHHEIAAMLTEFGAHERAIRERKADEPYFLITDCDICAYLPHHCTDLARDYSPEEIPGLETIHCDSSSDYKAQTTDIVKKCIHCGTYYHQYYFIDTEDPIGGIGADVEQTIERLSLLGVKESLRRWQKVDELAELETRYPAIVQAFTALCHSRSPIKPYIIPYVAATLADFFIIKHDWPSIRQLLLEHTEIRIVKETIRYLTLLSGTWTSDLQSGRQLTVAHAQLGTGVRRLLKENQADWNRYCATGSAPCG